MNKRMKITGISIILVVILAVIVIYYPSEPSESKFLLLKSGDTIHIDGKIYRISQVNTSYGTLDLLELYLKNFTDINLLDEEFFNIDPSCESLTIIGDQYEEYNIEDNVSITLHFEEFQLNDAKFLWVKEFGVYLKLPSAISEAIDGTSYVAGLYLKLNSSDNEGRSSYEVFTNNADKYSLDMFNVSLKKVTVNSNFQENVVFSTLLNNTLGILASEYVYISGGEGEKIDYMNSLEEGTSQNGFIEFIDRNSNGLIDDHDVFNLSIPPTENINELEHYLLQIGMDDFEIYNNIATGVKLIINWYDGIYEQLTERELIALSYVSHEENGTLIDTTLKVSRANSEVDLSIDNYQLELLFEKNYNYLREDLSEGIVIEEDNINVNFFDSNGNGLLDVDDLFLISGLGNKTSVKLSIINNQENSLVVGYPWVVGYGHIVGNVPDTTLENLGLESIVNNSYKIVLSVPYRHSELSLGLTPKVNVLKDDVLILENLTIEEGIIGTYNGKNVSFVDKDKDGYLSTDDNFIIECEQSSTYSLEVSILFDNYKYSAEIVS